jgi:hypothetical protein
MPATIRPLRERPLAARRERKRFIGERGNARLGGRSGK